MIKFPTYCCTVSAESRGFRVAGQHWPNGNHTQKYLSQLKSVAPTDDVSYADSQSFKNLIHERNGDVN